MMPEKDQLGLHFENTPRYGFIRREVVPYSQYLAFCKEFRVGYMLMVTCESIPGWVVPHGTYGVEFRERLP